MTILLIVVFVVIAAAGYIAYKIGSPDLTELKKMANQAMDKIEPSLDEVSEVLEQARKAVPENKVVKETAEKVEAATMAAKKIKSKK